jgi:hypothetical protein
MPKFLKSEDLNQIERKVVGVEIVKADDFVDVTPEQSETIPINVGEWYWLKPDKDDGKDVEEKIWCVVKVGTNMAKLMRPSRHGHHVNRVHFKEWDQRTRRELEPEKFIQQQVDKYQQEISATLAEIKSLMLRLGVTDHELLTNEERTPATTTELAVCSGLDNMSSYKKALTKAKDKQLPELFEKVKESSERMAKWLSASMLPLRGKIDCMDDLIDSVKGRIFNVELYAGLTERVTQITEGKPAPFSEKLRLMQSRLYMDEECLLNYRHGGMEFHKIGEFDAWLAEPENLARVFPSPRCMVSMQVRRNPKEREGDGRLQTMFINMALREADEHTYLYIRNGENLYRMGCKLDFGEKMFPEKRLTDLSEPMMVKMFSDKVSEIITVREWEEVRAIQIKNAAEFEEKMKPYREWEKAHPDSNEPNPHRWYGHGWNIDGWEEYEPLNENNLHYDEIMDHIKKQIDQYNRIVLIIQGLFDRSEVLHPHPPVQLWTAEGFKSSIDLVYDADNVLYHGDPPDFEAYRAKCNESIEVGSVVIGQDEFWEIAEAVKECRRRDNDWRDKGNYRPKRFRPEGNEGPGYLTKVDKIIRGKAPRVKFTWLRCRRVRWSWTAPEISTTLCVPFGKLFNVNAYKLGDYKQFFADPRTREQYLKWAPLLIAAEEYQSGNIHLSRKASSVIDDEDEAESDDVDTVADDEE